MIAFLHRIAARIKPGTHAPREAATPDPLHDHLRAAVAAETHAKSANVQTYQARVEAMIDDFFAKYGSRDVHRLH